MRSRPGGAIFFYSPREEARKTLAALVNQRDYDAPRWVTRRLCRGTSSSFFQPNEAIVTNVAFTQCPVSTLEAEKVIPFRRFFLFSWYDDCNGAVVTCSSSVYELAFIC